MPLINNITMFSVLRKLDDGYGSVHVVQKREYDSLSSLLEAISKEQSIDIDVNINAGSLQDHMEKNDFVGDVIEWAGGYLDETDVDMSQIGNPNGYGNNTDEVEIWEGDKLIAKLWLFTQPQYL